MKRGEHDTVNDDDTEVRYDERKYDRDDDR